MCNRVESNFNFRGRRSPDISIKIRRLLLIPTEFRIRNSLYYLLQQNNEMSDVL